MENWGGGGLRWELYDSQLTMVSKIETWRVRESYNVRH